MKYLESAPFTVPMGGKAYGDGWDRVFGKKPEPAILHCPECGVQHVDDGEWATRVHRTHQCQACGHEWRPCEYPTFGVAGLPAVAPP